jgi:hypothetical protein
MRVNRTSFSVSLAIPRSASSAQHIPQQRQCRDQQHPHDYPTADAVHSKTSYSNATPSGFFFEPFFGGVDICKDLEMVGTANPFAHVHVDEYGCHRVILYAFVRFRLGLIGRAGLPWCNPRSTPMRECITKSRPSAAPIRQPIAVCHCSRFCSGFDNFMM